MTRFAKHWLETFLLALCALAVPIVLATFVFAVVGWLLLIVLGGTWWMWLIWAFVAITWAAILTLEKEA